MFRLTERIAGQDGTVAETELGRVQGVRAAATTRFLGIPYAAPPVGDLRFRSPQPHPRWRGTRAATERPPSSIQTNAGESAWIYESSTLAPASEDCLYLNVWTPGTGGSRPVLVFFHGGSGRTGSGTVSCIEGSRLAADGDVVVVTFNYRLNAFGMLSHPCFRDPATGLSGNWGMQDQLAALGWVQRNIDRFGGDPGRVTVAGQSSSAGDVRYLMLQRASRSLYEKVILSSLKLSVAGAPADAACYAELLAHRLATTVRGLRGLPARVLHDAEVTLAGDRAALAEIGGARLSVIVDGQTTLFPSSFGRDHADVPVLIGTNRNEQYFHLNLFAPDGTRVSAALPPADEQGMLEMIESELAAWYPKGHPPPIPAQSLGDVFRASMASRDQPTCPSEVFMEFDTDLVRRGPAAQFAARHTEKERQPAYLYELAQPLVPPGRGTPHTADLPFVFGTYVVPFLAARIGESRQVSQVSRALGRAWTRFARTGDPRCEQTADWVPYRHGSRSVATFGGEELVRVADDPRGEQLNALGVLSP